MKFAISLWILVLIFTILLLFVMLSSLVGSNANLIIYVFFFACLNVKMLLETEVKSGNSGKCHFSLIQPFREVGHKCIGLEHC
uniref:Uncharacterized protein n=1 Tax=Rhizophora mucronata TaxID=61149 RepID=A0A2P2JTS1_RHIMU